MKRRVLYLRSKFARVLYRLLPFKLNGAVAVLWREGKVLVVERADSLGYCFPGGLGKRNEAGEETVRRELLEETGLTMTTCCFAFRYPETGGFSELTSVYEVGAVGELRGSREGKPLWLSVDEISAHIYRPQVPVLEYLRRSADERRHV